MAETIRSDADLAMATPRVYDTGPDGTGAYRTPGESGSSGATSMSGEPTLGELISSLSTDFSELVRKEIKLAKVETTETITRASKGAIYMAAGGFVAYAGLILLLIGLGILVGNAIDSLWLGILLIGVVVAGVGGVLLSSGLTKIKNLSVTPDKTIQTLKDDARFVKEKIS